MNSAAASDLNPDVLVRTVDYHAGGQPIRIVLAGGPQLPGASAAAKRASALASAELDASRKLLCWEPRGHADMYACFLFDSAEDDCDFGAVFCHGRGYPPSCGHGSLALGVFAVEYGVVHSEPSGVTMVTIEVPAGRAVVSVRQREGRVVGAWLESGRAHVVAVDQNLHLSTGPMTYDLVFSGAHFACVDALAVGLHVDESHHDQLVLVAKEMLSALATDAPRGHTEDERLNGVFGVIFWEDLGSTPEGRVQRAVNIFNDGWVERSPGAAVTGARLALLTASGELPEGASLIQQSLVGTRSLARAAFDLQSAHAQAVRTQVEGTAYRTGEHCFTVDESDPLGVGFSRR